MAEHHLDVIAAADWVVDLGPEAGAEGGLVVYEGQPQGLLKAKRSETGRCLGELSIEREESSAKRTTRKQAKKPRPAERMTLRGG